MSSGLRALARSIQTQRDRLIHALSNLSSGNYFQTGVTGGEVGDANGFGIWILGYFDQLPSTTGIVTGKAVPSSQLGWELYHQSPGDLLAAVSSGAGAWATAPAHRFLSSDLSRMHVMLLYRDANRVRLWVDRLQRGEGTGIVGFTSVTNVGQGFGSLANIPSTQLRWVAQAAFRGQPTEAQLLDYFDRARLTGDFGDFMTQPSATEAEILDTQPTFWLRADDVVTSGGAVTAIRNRMGSDLFLSTGTAMGLPYAEPLLNGRQALSFTIGQHFTSNLSAAAWKYLHDGSGMEVWHILVPRTGGVRIILSTRPGTGYDIGANHYWNPANALAIGNGTANVFPPVAEPNGLVLNAPCALGASHKQSESTQGYLFRHSGVSAASASAATPSSADPAATLRLGADSAGNYPADMAWSESIGWSRRLRDSERAKLIAYFCTQVPQLCQTTITHRQSIRVELKGKSPTPRQLGARNLTTLNFFQSAKGQGLRGSLNSPFWRAVTVRFDALPAGNQHIMGHRNVYGWGLQCASTALSAYVIASGNTPTSSYTITAGDVGVFFPILVHYTGTALRLYVRRAQVGTDAVGQFSPSNPVPFVLGAGVMSYSPLVATQAFTAGSVFQVAGGDTDLTLAEIQQWFDDCEQTGALAEIPNRTEHLYDLTKDTDLSAGIVPAIVQDRKGTAHLTRMGGAWTQDANSVWFAGGGYYQATATGVLAGAQPWMAVKLRIRDLTAPTMNRYVLSKANGGNAGVELRFTSATTLQFLAADGSGARVGPGFTVDNNDVGVVRTIVARVDAAGARRLAMRSRSQEVASAPYTGYTPSPLALSVGSMVGSWPLTSTDIIGFAVGSGDLTDAEVDSLLADSSPTTAPIVAGKTERRFYLGPGASSTPLPLIYDLMSSGEQLLLTGRGLELAAYVPLAPPAPSQLVDQVTKAAADAASRAGSPIVVASDSSRDGRRALGVQGYTAAAGLEGPANSGNFPTTGVYYVALHRVDGANVSGTPFLLHASLSIRGAGGYGNVAVAASSATSGWNGANYYGVVAIHIAVNTGAAHRYYVDTGSGPQQIGADVAEVLPSSPGQVLAIGRRTNISTHYADNSSWFGSAWGAIPGGPSLAQLTDLCSSIRATGRIQGIPGATLHLWDPQIDIPAAGDTLPLQILDRIGTDHLTRVGGLRVFTHADGTSGLTDWSVANVVQSRPSGGIQGSATGWWVSVLVRVLSAGSTYRTIWTTYNGTGGTFIRVDSSNRFASGTSLSTYQLQPADYGTLRVLTFVYTGTVGRLYLDGAKLGSDYTTTYTPVAVSSTLGVNIAGGNKDPGTDIAQYGVVGSNTDVLTDAEVLAHAQATLAAKRVQSVSGKTPFVYDLQADIAEAGGNVPVIVKERASGAEPMAVVGAPLQVAQRTERVSSYEVNAIAAGVSCPSVADFYESASPILPGDAAGFWAATGFVLTSQNVPTTAGRHLLSSILGTPGRGWYQAFMGTNTSLQCGLANAGNTWTPSTTTFTAADVGKLFLLFIVYDAPAGRVRSYIRRAEVGTGAMITGYAPSNGIIRITNGLLSAHPGEGLSVLGFMCGLGVPTLSEVQASHDGFLASDGDFAKALIAGKTSYAMQFRGLTTAPNEITPIVGTIPMVRNGSPTIVPQYARVAGW